MTDRGEIQQIIFCTILLVVGVTVKLVQRWRPLERYVVQCEARLAVRIGAGILTVILLGAAQFFRTTDTVPDRAIALGLAAGPAYVIMCSVPPRKGVVILRRFGSENVRHSLRELLRHAAGTARFVTLSDRLFDRTELNPWWSEGIAYGVALLVVFVSSGFIVGLLVALVSPGLDTRNLLFSLLGLIAGGAVTFVLVWLGPRLFAWNLRGLAWLMRSRVRVSTLDDVASTRRRAAFQIRTPIRLSPFPPVLSVQCDDAVWRPTVQALIALADAVLVVDDGGSENLDWELEAARQHGKPVIRLGFYDTWSARAALAEALERRPDESRR
jgi:hypothetical protein